MRFVPTICPRRLLMNLLSETAGLSHSLRILTVFDKHFQRLWRARDIKLIVEDDFSSAEKRCNASSECWINDKKDKKKVCCERFKSLWVLWNDATIGE